jgi:hypothetical protein
MFIDAPWMSSNNKEKSRLRAKLEWDHRLASSDHSPLLRETEMKDNQ